jgi:hypothetical protein
VVTGNDCVDDGADARQLVEGHAARWDLLDVDLLAPFLRVLDEEEHVVRPCEGAAPEPERVGEAMQVVGDPRRRSTVRAGILADAHDEPASLFEGDVGPIGSGHATRMTEFVPLVKCRRG